MNCEPVQRVLDACLDGELDPATQVAVQLHLQSCPACSALHLERLTLRDALRQLPRHKANDQFRVALGQRLDAEEASPASGLRPVGSATHRPRLPGLWQIVMSKCGFATLLIPPRGAAGTGGLGALSGIRQAWVGVRQAMQVQWLPGTIAGALVGFVFGLWMGGLPSTPDVRDAMIAQHLASFEGSALRVDVASSDRHTVKPWFAGRLDFAPTVRDLSQQGFTLVGGRLDAVAGEPAAVLVYQLRKHQISLFISRAEGAQERPLVVSTLRGFAVATWVHDGLAHATVSDLDPRELRRFAEWTLAPARP